MSLFPLFILVIIISTYIIHLNYEELIKIFDQFFPETSKTFLDVIVSLSSKRAVFGIFSFIVAFYFASNLFTTLYSAIVYTFEGKGFEIRKFALIYILGIPIFKLILITIYTISIFLTVMWDLITGSVIWDYVYSLFKQLNLEFVLTLIFNVTSILTFLLFWLILFVIYFYLAPRKNPKHRNTVFVSLLVAVLLFFIKYIFNQLIIFVAKVNPIYGSLSGIFAFLVWLHVGFGLVLIGSRMIYYLEDYLTTDKTEN
ncbi:MAG: hypothetical protein GXO22_03015 [Aquificae bacterium]|nr:hypothetical protein [Aquificota bacterium]